MGIAVNKSINLTELLGVSYHKCCEQYKKIAMFVIANYLICALALLSWKTAAFWLVIVIMYVMWGIFYRWYFGRIPYCQVKSLLYSTVPSTKIVVLSLLVATAIILLPIVPLFLGIPAEMYSNYENFLQQNLVGEASLLNVAANLILMLLSPIIFYRPMLAWIATLLGRSGSLNFAWEKTRGNYFKFLMIAIFIDLSASVIYEIISIAGGNIYVALIPLSVIMVYFNIVIAELYKFFFLDI